MDRARHKRNYDLHSWTGVLLGIFLFVVCFSGSVAVFTPDIARWENPETRISMPDQPETVGETFDAWVKERSLEGQIEHLELYYPMTGWPYYRLYADVHLHASEKHQHEYIAWHPVTLEPLETREATISDWLSGFHRDFKWPAALGGGTIGSFIVGLAGVVLLLSTVTGIVAHTKIREESFTLRLNRSVRVRWQDPHKVLGLWGAPFHFMIGLSGAILGVVAVLGPIAAVLSYKGDVDALIVSIQGETSEPAGITAEMLPIDAAFEIIHQKTGEVPFFISVEHWGDQNAIYNVRMKSTSELLNARSYLISGVTGQMLPQTPEQRTETPGTRVNAAMRSLHFGTFGNVALRILWCGLGLSLSIVIALGTMMWIERRTHGNIGSRSNRFYNGLSRLNIGVCVGLGFATSALFLQNVIYSGSEIARANWIIGTFFGAWGLAIVHAFFRSGIYQSNRELIGASGVLLIFAALINQMKSEISSTSGIPDSPVIVLTDLLILSSGLISLFISWKLPNRRITKDRKSQTMTPV